MNHPAEISQQAAEWFALMMAGEPAAEDHARFRHWLEGDPACRRAYAEYERLWAGAGAVPNLAERLPQRRLARRTLIRGGLAAGLAALALGGGGAWMAREHVLADHRTGTGERRIVRLPDGSVAELSTMTSLSLHFGAGERRVMLHKGEVFFTVAADRARPFRVEAGGGTVTALGTAFQVTANGRDTRVVVTEHAVSVAAGGGEVRVEEGQEVRYDTAGLSVIETVDPALSLSWRQGQLAFMSVPLSEVLEAVERWIPGRIVLMDEALKARLVTVILDTSRGASMLDTLAQALPIRVISITPYLTLIQPV